MKVGLPLDQEMHWPSLREPTQARQVPEPVAEVVEVLESVSAASAGTAAAATARAPMAAIRRAREFAEVISGLSLETVSTLTIPWSQFSRSQVVAAGLFEQAAAVGLQSHQVTEQRVVLVALLHRGHPLQL